MPDIPRMTPAVTAARRRRRAPKVTPQATQHQPAGTSSDYRDRMSRDPNFRSKQPDSALTPSQLRARKLNARLNRYDTDPLYNPGQQLSGRDLVHSARTLAGLEIDPTVKALEREGRSATTQGTALIGHAGDIYRGLKFSDAQSEEKQRALASMLSASTANVGTDTRAALAQIGPEEAQRAAADADVRGSLGADSRVAEEVAHDRAIFETMQGQAQASANRQGADWVGLAQAASQARQMRGGETQGQLINRLANTQGQIREKITDEEAKRGPLTTKNLLDLRQQAFENVATQTGLGIKQSAIDATLAGIRQRDEASKRTARTSRANVLTQANQSDINNRRTNAVADARNAETHRHNLSSESLAKIKAGTEKEPASATKLRSSVLTVADEIKGLRGKKGYGRIKNKKARRIYVQNIIRKRAGGPVPPQLLGPATDLAEDGHVSKRNARLLESFGVKVPKGWIRR